MQGPLRIIFSLAILAIWAVFGYWLANGQWSPLQWTMLLAAHAGCAIVFYNFAYVFSYGYAISVLIVNLIVLATVPTLSAALVCGASIAYGLRLWQFIHQRNRDQSYAALRQRGNAIHGRTPLVAKFGLWIMMSWLMAFQGMSGYFAATRPVSAALLIGVLVMLAGLVLEALADAYKQRVKRGNSQALVNTGLYQRVRHPNYLGEIIFQIGTIIVASAIVGDFATWIACIAAPLYIAILMYYAAHEADHNQQQRLGDSEDYRQWRQSSGMLLPRI